MQFILRIGGVMWLSRIVILTLIITIIDKASLGEAKKSKKPQPVCGKDYMRQVNGKCYYFGIKKINWYGALNNCLRKGLTLADLGTLADFEAVSKYLSSQNIVEDFWFGGNDLAYDGKFTYISSGQTIAQFGDNIMLAPTNSTSLDKCLEIRLRQDASLVTNENCQERQNFICEKHSQMKCEIPGPEDGNAPETHHSHEHLHHFHHDVIKDRAVKDSENPKQTSKEESEKNSKEGDEAKSDGNNAKDSATTDTADNEKEVRASSSETPEGNTKPDTDNKGTANATSGTDGGLAHDEAPHTTAATPTAAADGATTPAEAAAGAESTTTPAEAAAGAEPATTPAEAAAGAEPATTPAEAAADAEPPTTAAAEGLTTEAPTAEASATEAPAAEESTTEAPAADGETTAAPTEEAAPPP